MKKTIGLVTALAALALAQAAAGYSGEITRADANDTWTRGSLAGSVNWTDCSGSFCSWLPVATVQPALPTYNCRGDEGIDSDPNTVPVWSGGTRTANGLASFDVTEVPIVAGVHGQRLCLTAIEKVRMRDPVCVAQAPILGMDPNDCPLIDRIVGRVITSRFLTVPQRVEPRPSDPRTPVVDPPTVVPPVVDDPAPTPPRRVVRRAAGPVACGTIVGPTGRRLPVRIQRGNVRCADALRAARTFLPRRGRGKQRFRLAGRVWTCTNAHGVALRRGRVAQCMTGRVIVEITAPAKKKRS